MTVPLDFSEFFTGILERDRRIPDGKLHPSTHLTGHLRHTQLDLAGAPKRVNGFSNSMRLMAGTMFHEMIHDQMRRRGIAHMPEVQLDQWLPWGWAGTADCLMWNAEHRAFALIDYKTIEGKGIDWIERLGAKEPHIWQLSAYLYACEEMGIPLFTDEGYMLYVPITDGVGTRSFIVETVKPLDKEMLHDHMADIKSSTDTYLDSLSLFVGHTITDVNAYLTNALADPPAREQKLFWDKDKKIWHVRLVPPWGARYCPYDEPLCTCSSLGTAKIGEFSLEREYLPRDGYEEFIPTVVPSASEINRRKATK